MRLDLIQGKSNLSLFSFSRSERILKRAEFTGLSKTGHKIQSEHFIALIGPGRSRNTRLGITVTRKVGCAATRNRIKRFVREYFRTNKHQVQGKWDIHVIAKKSAAAISSKQANSSLKTIFIDSVRKLDH